MIRWITLAAVAIALLTLSASAQEPRRGEARDTAPAATAGLGLVRTDGTLAVPLVTTPPKIDGKLDDDAWKHAQPLRLWSHGGKPALYDSVGYLCRDNDNFYFAAICQEDDLPALVKDAKAPVLYRNDCVEIFIVPDRDAALYAHVMLSCDGQYLARIMFKDAFNEPTVHYPLPKMTVAAGQTKDGWIVEGSLPIKDFGREIKKDSVWAFGFNREKHTAPSDVSEFLGGFNTPDKYPPTYFDNRTIVLDGVGVKNIGDKPTVVIAELQSIDKTDVQTFKLDAGDTKQLDWQKLLGKPAAGNEFTINLTVASNPIARETYRVAPAGVKPAPGEPRPAPAPVNNRRPPRDNAAPAAPAPALADLPPLKLRDDSPLKDPKFFPISVWAQQARNAKQYHDSGINVFVSPSGWNDAASQEFKSLGMYAVMGFNPRLKDDPQVMAWMHGDEPDNGSPDATRSINDFRNWRQADPSRPVYVNLGQGVANERFGVLTPDNYRAYCQAADIISFDVYPVTNIGAGADGHNRLAITAKGVSRLIDWTDGQKPVWIILETTHINNRREIPTAAEVKTQVWMSLVHGSKGIGYFCHDFTLSANTSVGLMLDKDMMKAVKDIDQQVLDVAPALNSPTITEGVTSKSSMESRVDVMVKKSAGDTYIFAVNMFNKPEKPTITVPGLPDGKADVLGENRQVDIKAGQLLDPFAPYAVHLYKVH